MINMRLWSKKQRIILKIRFLVIAICCLQKSKRLIHLKKFYKVKTEQGLAFADDEGDYYYLFLYVNMSVSFTFPSLEKDILIENVYYEGRKNKKQEIFESFLLDSGCEFLNTYRSIEDRPSLSPDKFF